ncbi:piggyBac transposable element-derived protein 4 [Biomphalaria pfeifferi]|uniref:PiggyBac transposable element-derived protein 4 n=1 Tax=Biomphalaria pfeifferi TaxID=112525 RepID=A0AAD8C3G2_BIOPF|nr:piggyBac transposable element-derived protein 4 [Biomphalaria pfeifferi]
MTTPIHGMNRNCTFDYWFTSINTARKLYDDHAVTMVGTMKENKAEIPPSFVELRGRENSAMFAFSGVLTLLSCCPPKPKKKIVMLLSTMHRRGDTTETVRLPDMVQFYNETKCGVDTFDQLCHRYSVSRRTRRWPLTVFYGLLNAVGVNSMILLKGSHADDKDVG